MLREQTRRLRIEGLQCLYKKYKWSLKVFLCDPLKVAVPGGCRWQTRMQAWLAVMMFKRQIRRLLRIRSLRLRLVLPFVAVILLLTVVLGWMFWWAGSKGVADLTGQLMVERTERLAEAVERHMQGAGAVLESAFPQGMAGYEDIRPVQAELTSRFYAATSLFPDPSDQVYYGNEQGQSFALQRLADGNAQLRVKDTSDKACKTYLLYGIESRPEYRFAENAHFDPRERLWYQLGRAAAQHKWTGVYLDFDSGELVNSRVRQVLDRQGQVVGVVGTDILLSGLNRFIQGLAISKNSQAFIVEPDGQLVASSAIPYVQREADGRHARVNVAHSGEQLASQAWLQLQQLLPGLPDDSVRSLVLDDVNGQRVFVATRHILDSAGLDWYAVIAVPASDILDVVHNKVVLVIYCGVLAILLAIPLGMIMLARVVDDVAQLSRAVGSATVPGNGLLREVYRQVRRKDEIGSLARSFKKMHKELLTDRLTGVASRSAVEHDLGRLLVQRRKTGQPFTVLFIDLNKFKPLNDRFGHETGDSALIEIAARMQQMLRGQDMLARWGGDEFVIILPDVTDPDTAVSICERLQSVISQPLECCPGYQLSAAVGVALFPHDGRDEATLLRAADHAMYAEKQAC